MEKRVLEASSLREFIGSQFEHLRQLINESHKRHDEKISQQQQLTDAIEHIVDRVDTRIRGISSYKNQLRSSARELINYIKDMVSGLPVAVPMGKDSYINESIINAVFASNGEIEDLVRQSDEIKQFAREHMQSSDYGLHVPDFYVLMFVIREEHQIFGSEMINGALLKDVSQTAVNFYGHRLVAPALSEMAARSALEKIMFESTIAALHSNMVKMRHSETHDERIVAALNPEKNINNPEVYLKLLTEQLSMPKNIIALQSNMIRVSKMGIKLSADSNDLSNEFNLQEFEIGNANSKVVFLIQLKYSEWI